VKVENALKEFQTQNRTVAIEAQSKAMIEATAMIQAQIMAQEVQLQVMGSYLSPNNPEVARVQSSIHELRKQLQTMETGKSGKDRLPGDRLRPAITSVPTLALEYGRLARDLKVQETLYALLISQYEQAKLTEARDTPTVQVLDPAIPAERKSRPKIALNLLIAGILSLLTGILWTFLREAIDRRKSRFSPLPSFSLHLSTIMMGYVRSARLGSTPFFLSYRSVLTLRSLANYHDINRRTCSFMK
jgi:capsule polysaccharide export protein KpsE/RkpR